MSTTTPTRQDKGKDEKPKLCTRSEKCQFYKADDSRLTCDGYNRRCQSYTAEPVTKKTDLSKCHNSPTCKYFNGWTPGDKCDGHNLTCRSYVSFYEVVPCNLGKCSRKCETCEPFRKWAETHRERRLKITEGNKCKKN